MNCGGEIYSKSTLQNRNSKSSNAKNAMNYA